MAPTKDDQQGECGLVETSGDKAFACNENEANQLDIDNHDGYHSSQPWPFPGSIMLGFYAEAKSTFIRRNDNEVEDVQWFDVNQLRNFASYGKSLPRLDSIARRLIEDWLETKV